MIIDAPSLWLRESAAALARRVQAGELRPLELVQSALSQIASFDARVNAFQCVRGEQAEREALALETRADLNTLPLAGLPIAIKDNLHVAGLPTRYGSSATPDRLSESSNEVVRRVQAAGAIVVGKTRMPEIGLWGTTDGAWGVTRNPWDVTRTCGGSSGGSAAAVALGLTPFAIGNDGLGSIRIPAACCGLFGIKPGVDVVPLDIDDHNWHGFTENGPLTTTVEDAALLLSVMADRAELRSLREPAQPLRIALSTRAPGLGITIDAEYVRAAEQAAQLLRAAGHTVQVAHPPYSTRVALAVLGHWFQAAHQDSEPLRGAALEARTLAHARWGPAAQRLGLVGPQWRQEWRTRTQPLFDRYDVLLTPTLARPPIPALAWAQRSWLTNLSSNIRFAPFCAPWNLAGYPAASVPLGRHSSGIPMAVQLVALPGRENLLLGLARQLERQQPWTRHAPRPVADGQPLAEKRQHI